MPKKIDEVAGSLWTPGGEHVLREKDVVPIGLRDIQSLAWLHEFAFRHHIKMVCERCGHPIHGTNNGHEAQPAVSCHCTEWRYTR